MKRIEWHDKLLLPSRAHTHEENKNEEYYSKFVKFNNHKM